MPAFDDSSEFGHSWAPRLPNGDDDEGDEGGGYDRPDDNGDVRKNEDVPVYPDD